MLFRIILLALILGIFAGPALAQENARAEQVRLTVGVPVYVYHNNGRPGPEGWNDGWFNNEGVFADLSWPVRDLGPRTKVRAGFTGGAFENSFYDISVFLGGMAEMESFATERLAFQAGAYAGLITGYKHTISGAAAPYLGMSYSLTNRLDLGLRGFWLPAETVADLAPSDAWIATATIGTRF